jgi:hypothetical protein
MSVSLDPPSALRKRQCAFAAHIRDPGAHPRPDDVPERRMALYRELFFNNINNFLASGFPVLRAIMAEEAWTSLVQGFFSSHKSRTPYFAEIAEEFLTYLHKERKPQPADPPFLLELAHYEWVESAVAMAEGNTPEAFCADDPLSQRFAVSELAWPLAYRFAVHRIGPDFQPREVPERSTYMIVFRDNREQVRFMEINAVTYRLLQLIEERPDALAGELMAQISEELRHPNPAVVTEGGAAALKQLSKRGIVGLANLVSR